MSIIKKLRWKDKSGKTTDYDLGAKASNVEQDSTHRFVSDTEKQTWNGKANPGDIPSGSAANYGVANNDTTNRSDQLVTAQVAYQHGKEIDQLISEISQLKNEFEKRFNSKFDLQSLPLKSAIAYVLDNDFAGFTGSFDTMMATSEGWYRVEGTRDFDGAGFGFANALGAANIPYCYDRTAGADAVLKRID